jgi:hypothetical protein
VRSFGKIPYFRLPQTPECVPLDLAFGGDERLRLIFVIGIITYLRKKYIVVALKRNLSYLPSNKRRAVARLYILTRLRQD